MIRIAIVEDEAVYANCLGEYIDRFAGENGLTVSTAVFHDGIDITDGYRPNWDIIFLDIKMKHMDGLAAAREIRRFDPSVILIFITSMARYAIRGYEVDALDFVLKPVNYAQFSLRMTKAVKLLEKLCGKYLMLPDGEGRRKVSTDEILYIEVKGHELHFVTETKTHVMRCSMQEMERELAGCHFSRCNHCYLVNLKHVTGVEREIVYVQGHALIVSRPKKKQFLKELSDYFGAGYL